MNYVIVSMVELTAVGIYINYWLPDVPQWLSALICLIIITVINLINVKLYGEFEFCTAIIKVVAICCMIILVYILFVQIWEHFLKISAIFGVMAVTCQMAGGVLLFL